MPTVTQGKIRNRASWLAAKLGRLGGVGVVIHGGGRIAWVGLRLWALLGLSAEDPSLEPGHPRQGLLKLVGQLGDLGLLPANDLLEALSLVLPSCFSLGSTGMQRPPIVCLLPEFDLQATDFGILNEHAGMVRASPRCVQPPAAELPQRPRDNHGFTEYLRATWRPALQKYVADQGDPITSHGLLKQVTDPNGVVTTFTYDHWGQIADYGEGLLSPGALPVYACYHTLDANGQVAAAVCGGNLGERATSTNCMWSIRDLHGCWRSVNCCAVPVPPPTRSAPSWFPVVPEAPELPSIFAEWTVPDNGYTSAGQLKKMDVTLYTADGEQGRDFSMAYDELNRMISNSIESDEWGLTRGFTYAYDAPRGRYTRTGPDGVETLMEFDIANRLTLLRRGPEEAPLIWVRYEYYDNGLVRLVSQGGAAQTAYCYDEANQLLRIDHQSTAGNLPHLVYTYNARGLPETVTEFNHLRHELAEVTFTYDNLGRLIHEVRYDVIQGQDVYDLGYKYDPGGNRTTKTDAVNELEVQYHHDVDDPGEYASANNRLMYYETFDTSGGGQVLESTTYYFYNSSGNVTRVVTNQEGSNEYEATLLGYARNESTVTFVLGERWDWDGDPAHDPTGYDIAYAREFRYDGARQRYLNRELDPNELRDNDLLVSLNDVWSDYDGDQIYADFTIDEDGNVTYERWYEPRVARAIRTPYDTVETQYYHGDLIGTTRDVSYMGHSRGPAVYTAFGELIDGTNHRYGYAGRWGYQAHEDFSFLHVGARYYDPATGRFMQRDPIGVGGGLNVYAYVDHTPTDRIDPDGLQRGTKRFRWCKGPNPQPYKPPGYKKIHAPDSAWEPMPDPSLTNLLMLCTGGNFIPNVQERPISPPHRWPVMTRPQPGTRGYEEAYGSSGL